MTVLPDVPLDPGLVQLPADLHQSRARDDLRHLESLDNVSLGIVTHGPVVLVRVLGLEVRVILDEASLAELVTVEADIETAPGRQQKTMDKAMRSQIRKKAYQGDNFHSF